MYHRNRNTWTCWEVNEHSACGHSIEFSEKLRQNSQSKTTFKLFAINSTKREKQCLKQKRKQSSWDWVILSSLDVFQSLSNNFAITMESKQRFAYRARLWLWLDFRWGSWNVSHHCLKHFFPELPSIELFRQFLFPSFIVAFQTSSTISLYNFFQLFFTQWCDQRWISLHDIKTIFKQKRYTKWRNYQISNTIKRTIKFSDLKE